MKDLIREYCNKKDKRAYDEILYEYKCKYIYNESKVEGKITPEEQLGIAVVYDYINNFDFDKDYFNIFTTSLLIHQKLYSKCFDKSFGGTLRNTQAILNDTNIEVMSAEEAKIYFNSFIKKSDEIFLPLMEGNILKYIENCIFITTELIKAQPFIDGNKRTFRSLLNLLLKRISLPPVYISIQYRKEYKSALLKALKFSDYDELYQLYYLLIDNSIKELALEKDDSSKIKKYFNKKTNG